MNRFILLLIALSLCSCNNLRKAAEDVSAMVEKLLNRHNYYRAQHQVGDLKLLDDLVKMAQESADDMAATNTFAHTGKKYEGKWCGENLYKCWTSGGSCYTGEEAADDWYDEIKDYDFTKGEFGMDTGHFTQLVWKESEYLGCGIADGKDGDWKTTTVVCNYYPGGNVQGQFVKNVLPKK